MLTLPQRSSVRVLPIVLALLAAPPCTWAQYPHRQAELSVRVETPAGQPIAGATVTVEMINPAFRFGTAVAANKVEPGNPGYDARTVEMLQRYFNSITYENALKWTEYESRSPERNREIVQNAYDLQAFESGRPMRQRGHTTIWGSRPFVPDDAEALSGAALRSRIINHITDYHTVLLGQGIDGFDLYNEPFNERALLIEKLVPGGTPAQQAAEIATWYKKAKEIDPTTPMFINEYNILNFWQENDANVHQYKQLVDLVRDAGGDIDGIGVQGHMDRFTTKEQITRRLNILAAPMAPTAAHPNGLPGLPIEVTELDINTQQWTNATPAQQAQVTANVLDAAFEHPSVQGITIWVMNDSAHWRGNAILFDDANPTNWQVKPSGQVWIDRVKGTWWTDVAGVTGAAGEYTTPVFKGTHRIRVEYLGEVQELERDLTSDSALTVQLNAAPIDPTQSRLTNLAVRAPLAANQTLQIGFVVTGGPLPILLRAAGPALNGFGLVGLPDPRLTVYKDQVAVAANDDWPASLTTTFSAAGAFGFDPGSRDAALLETVTGLNSAAATGATGGVVLVEAYDRSGETAAAGPRLINVSALHQVGTGADILIAGFNIAGTGHKRLLIRAIGPKLTSFPGYTPATVLADPQVALYRVQNNTSTLLQTNDDWAPALAASFDQAGAFMLDAGSKDAALVAIVPAGFGYTVQASGANGGTGAALIEIYELP